MITEAIMWIINGIWYIVQTFFNFLFDVVLSMIEWVVLLIPGFDEEQLDGFHSAIGSIFATMERYEVVFPFDHFRILLAITASIFTTMWGWKIIDFVINKVRGSGS